MRWIVIFTKFDELFLIYDLSMPAISCPNKFVHTITGGLGLKDWEQLKIND